ncbi:metallophosphoesterase family protein [Aquisphaera insulae]|uniref:metallophosphoesterase family protein n=1 Tax=Aquisphaera insulae TaxID=2712864 RepID=UPI0013EBE438|nr:metallophosphoesterase family protein [Aquisphaera insulae]
MRILVVSDIHANWPALSAIDEEYDVCLCLGDLVDYGPDPVSCVRWAMEHATYSIRGNHDHGVAQGIRVKGESGFRYLTGVSRPSMWEALGPDERRYLLQLPVTQRATLAGKDYLLVHATPRDPLDEYLLKDPEVWARRLADTEADIVCVGHSHLQFNLQVGRTVVLNPGSVGLPRDGDPRAAYAIIEDNRIELKRIPYPVEETVSRIEAMPWPRRARDMTIASLRTGRLPGPPGPDSTDDPSTGRGSGEGRETRPGR